MSSSKPCVPQSSGTDSVVSDALWCWCVSDTWATTAINHRQPAAVIDMVALVRHGHLCLFITPLYMCQLRLRSTDVPSILRFTADIYYSPQASSKNVTMITFHLRPTQPTFYSDSYAWSLVHWLSTLQSHYSRPSLHVAWTIAILCLAVSRTVSFGVCSQFSMRQCGS